MSSEPSPSITTGGRGRLIFRFALRLIRVPIAVYISVVLIVLWFENSLIYFPTKYPDGDWQPPGLKFEDAWFTSADGTRLHGWYVPAERPTAVILFCHGNAGNISHRADVMQAQQQLVGATLLAFDYRGYGRSEGTPHEAGVLSDARTARKWLAEKVGIAERDIVLMGESLGGAVAVDLAARDGARGLILEDTFTSLPEMATLHYPWLPSRWLMSSRLDSLALISQYHGPLLQAHGDADTVVPLRYGERLFAAANEPKQLFIQRGADHNAPRSREFYRELKKFLDGLPPAR